MKILFEKKFPLDSWDDNEIKFDIWDEDKEHLGAIQPDTLIISGLLAGNDTPTMTTSISDTDLTGIKLESLAKGVVSDTKGDSISIGDATVFPFGPIAYDATGTYNGEYIFTTTPTGDDHSEASNAIAYLYVKVLYEE